MQSCWKTDANERPSIADIRQQLEKIFERNREHYGYIPITGENEENV